ncbi:LppU/SCO3897 family protein [Kitasatospora mediocidica]|uniref:LppU/SCO3897 family protein n=1 Tax=Kitasatospora mediocidica TaxID=58352 RepID=UPI00068A0260|nr:hypothetical protein [Kitasatospora mediocidica]
MSNPYPPPNPYAPQGRPPLPSPYGRGPVPVGYPPAPGYGYPTAPPPPGAYGRPPAGYPQPYPYAPPAQMPGGGYPQGYHPGGPACRICGGFPAVDVTVHGHRGMIVIMRFLRRRGPFCRICGTATVRDMSQQTLLRGWWAYLSSVFTLIALLRNRAAYRKIRQLPPPAPGTHGPQLDPGVPLTRRGAIFMLALPIVSLLLALGLLIVQAALFAGTAATKTSGGSATGNGSDVATAKAGDCVHNEHPTTSTEDPTPKLVIVPCGATNAEYKVAGRIDGATDGATACRQQFPSASTWYTRESGGDGFVLCLLPN